MAESRQLGQVYQRAGGHSSHVMKESEIRRIHVSYRTVDLWPYGMSIAIEERHVELSCSELASHMLKGFEIRALLPRPGFDVGPNSRMIRVPRHGTIILIWISLEIFRKPCRFCRHLILGPGYPILIFNLWKRVVG